MALLVAAFFSPLLPLLLSTPLNLKPGKPFFAKSHNAQESRGGFMEAPWLLKLQFNGGVGGGSSGGEG